MKITGSLHICILLCIVLFLSNTFIAYSQDYSFPNVRGLSIFPSPVIYKDNAGNFPTCKSLLNDTLNKNNVKFRKVIESNYLSKDSTLKSKQLFSKTITFFNNHGDADHKIVYGRDGKILD